MPDRDKIIKLDISSESRSCIIPKRDFSTIYNRNIVSIKNALDRFKENKDLYDKLGIVHKTGFLFYGPPGTGKSSIARAIASYMGYNIRYINNKSDQYSIYEIPPKTVVLLEDLDCIIGTEARKEEKNKDQKQQTTTCIDMHDLLNLIDGVITPEDTIFIATTNYIDKIDIALKRPGRFDYVMHIGYMTKTDIRNFCKDFCIDEEKALEELKPKFPITGALFQRYLMENYLFDKKDKFTVDDLTELVSFLSSRI